MDEREANKKIVAAFFEAVSNGQFNEACALLHPDLVWWLPGSLPSSGDLDYQEFLEHFSLVGGAMEYASQTIVGMVAEGDKVAVEVHGEGRLKNGHPYDNWYHMLMTIKDGKVWRCRDYMDTDHYHSIYESLQRA